MKDEDCIFCKIIGGTAPSNKIYEDEDYIGILDIFPTVKGQSLVIPKKHVGSYVFDLSDKELGSLMVAVKKVAKMLQKSLNAARVNLVFEGYGVNHLHAKLYPAIGTEKHNFETFAKEEKYFEIYPGFVTTVLGPKASAEELKRLQKLITGK
jgi:histidine triad (HIT) family protein